MNDEQHEYHKEVGLNNYEKAYFKKTFGTNMERLLAFRKAISEEQKAGIYRGEPYTYKWFMTKGGKLMNIRLSRKKVDAYIKLVENGDST